MTGDGNHSRDTSRMQTRRQFLKMLAGGSLVIPAAGWLVASGGASAASNAWTPPSWWRRPPTPTKTPTPTPTPTNTPSPTPSPTTTPTPTPQPSAVQSIQSMVDAAAPGTIVTVPAGIYRETVTINKSLTLSGQPGAEIRGSDVWTGWTRSGNYWVHGGLPRFPVSNAPAMAGSNGRCNWPEQVFFDGNPLFQIATSPVSGQFAVNRSTGQVILADDPTGHTVEVTTRQYWIVGRDANVVIQGLAMTHAAPPAQQGAIQNNGYPNWTIRNNVLTDAHAAVIFLNGASGLQILDNEIARGGQEGISLDGTTSAVIRGNRIHDNNTEEFDPAWEAGGMKITNSSGTTVDGNTVFKNNGPGIWFDMNCASVTISNNRVHHNSGTGISYEISHYGKLSGNACWENGWRKPSSWAAAGILLNCSDNTEVSSNVLAWNVMGVMVLSQRRSDAQPVVGNAVHDNVIASSDVFSPGNRYGLRWMEDYAGPLYLPASNNRGANNQYWYPTTTTSAVRFRWTSDLSDLARFNQTPGEHSGRYISITAKDQALVQAGVPLTQEAH